MSDYTPSDAVANLIKSRTTVYDTLDLIKIRRVSDNLQYDQLVSRIEMADEQLCQPGLHYLYRSQSQNVTRKVNSTNDTFSEFTVDLTEDDRHEFIITSKEEHQDLVATYTTHTIQLDREPDFTENILYEYLIQSNKQSSRNDRILQYLECDSLVTFTNVAEYEFFHTFWHTTPLEYEAQYDKFHKNKLEKIRFEVFKAPLLQVLESIVDNDLQTEERQYVNVMASNCWVTDLDANNRRTLRSYGWKPYFYFLINEIIQSHKPCQNCGFPIEHTNPKRYCGLEGCNKTRARKRKQSQRSQKSHNK